MKKLLLTTLAISAMAGAAAAAPASTPAPSPETAAVVAAPSGAPEAFRLDEGQMDEVSAGLLDNFNLAIVVQTNLNVSPALAIATGVFSDPVAQAFTEATQENAVRIRQRIRR